MKRRSFMKRGTVAVSLAGVADKALAFLPDNYYQGASEWPETLPFRKDRIPRVVKEEVPGFFWLDAADFADYGGWALDTQFVAFMGSSYLIAPGTKEPVRDAVTTFNVTTPGSYRVWVRSKNWLPEHSPGTFALSVNGKKSETVFGGQKESEWSWQDGGAFELGQGAVQLALKDQTGYFGRCSSVALTRELDYTPPAGLDAFRKERVRLIGQQGGVSNQGAYDVVVVGAGPAGFGAALAAARLGAKTILINDRPVLGGNASEENGVPVQGAGNHFHGKHMRESGIVEEAVRLGLSKGWWPAMTRSFQTLVDQEPNLSVLNDTRLTGVDCRGKRIHSVQTLNTLQGTVGTIAGTMFIDTTGDGWLGYYAGADFALGRESFSEFQESLAPQKADKYTMSGCLRGPRKQYKACHFYRTVEHSAPQSFDRQSWFYTFDEAWEKTRGKFSRFDNTLKTGTWWMEHRGSVDDLWKPEEARDELFRVYFSMWNYVKNDWENRHLAENHQLDYVPFSNAKRESRRLLGDHVLSQNDLQNPVFFPDAVAHTGWPLDLHALEGIFDVGGVSHPGGIPKPTLKEMVKVALGAQIPFRSLYSRNISNLLMAGRCMSVTHIALGSVRVEAPCCVTGQVAGTAAALAVRDGLTPRELGTLRIKELQQTLLKDDVYIPGVSNRDPEDLARKAQVSASSFDNADTRPENVINGWGRPLEGHSNMWMSKSGQSFPQWVQLDFKKPTSLNRVSVTFDTHLDTNAQGAGIRPKTCVKGYLLEGRVNGRWTLLQEVKNNTQRFMRHSFHAVQTDAIRVTVLATHGSPCAQVYEIRAYNEAATTT